MTTPLPALLGEIRERLEKATPGPWHFSGNLPFYIDVKKPAPSLSKHDEDRPTYWRVEDALLVAHAHTDIASLLRALELCRERAHGAIQAGYWQMGKEYLAAEQIQKFDDELIRALKGEGV